MGSAPLATRLDLARRIATEAGKLTLDHFQAHDLAVEWKQDHSPVTVADRRAEQFLRDQIVATFPTDAILGEEFAERAGNSGWRWILDPIDGTKSFIRGVPLYGTMVGLEHERESVAGVVYIPALDECIYAARGEGAWHSAKGAAPKPARVSARSELGEALLCASDTRAEDPAKREAYARLQSAVAVSRTWGDCYGYLLVATGRAEIMIDPIMNVWDAAAIAPIVTEAGGTFTDWQGRATIYEGEGIATNGHLLEPVLALVRGN
ncbi:MAG TPA: histidinol-phosphatase [Pirellulales bacterium]|jgi:histidinol-phosphatase|nr:histidinol-phosphatase [Pirellulales bacterium]